MIRVIVADDHDLVREGLRSVFQRTEDIRVVADYEDGSDLLENAPTTDTADVILLDISMSRLGGMDVLQDLQKRKDAPPVLFLTLHPESERLSRAVRNGARGYVTKDAPNERVCEAVRIVAGGGLYLTQEGTNILLNTGDEEVAPEKDENFESVLDPLSSQERKVFKMLCKGFTQKEIAYDMGISVRSVSTYKQRLMKKLNVTSVVEMVRIGLLLEEE